MEKTIGLKIGNFSLSLPKLTLAGFKVGSEKAVAENILKDNLKNKPVPDFELSGTSAKSISAVGLAAKPTLLAFIATWSPAAEEQLSQLDGLAENTSYNVFVITNLESQERIKAYKKIGGYKVEFLFDPSGELLAKFNIFTVPKHVLVKRDLNIEESINGVLTKEELQALLSKL